jgi:helicase
MWIKIADPDAPLPDVATYTDVRALLPHDERFLVLAEKLTAAGVAVRRVPYLLESEIILRDDGPVVATDPSVQAVTYSCSLVRGVRKSILRTSGADAQAASDAFALMWHAHGPEPSGIQGPVPVDDVLPEAWSRLIGHQMLNPAQAEILPTVLANDDNLVVVAPTGAGKTVIGMASALKVILTRGLRAVWLVPQRSLTDELDRDLDGWRSQGLKVERLSGEHPIDVERLRDADLWVATTEKFEAVSRTAVLREAIDAIGCLVVDEIHLLGDDTRGSTLEAMLARVRDGRSRVRIVGLSATVANADELAAWLQARLVSITWRASRLSWQLPMIAAHTDWNVTEATRTRLAAGITRLVTDDGGSVLVFCGSKRNVRRTALVIAAARGADILRVHPDDGERVHGVCAAVGVGLHYKGWEYRHAAERAFRERRMDVLVATPTVAAGVNLPARAVVVRDTQVGLSQFDVATMQQMFGRAGRIGTGETEGLAFLLSDETERAQWQARLVAGNLVRSQILSSLADHVLGEVVRQAVTSVGQAEQWWVQTLAHHQGNRSLAPLRESIRLLQSASLIDVLPGPAGDIALTPTELGSLTARLMVSTTVGHALRVALGAVSPPAGADDAERVLIDVLSATVPKLAQASVSDDARVAVAQVLAAEGRISQVDAHDLDNFRASRQVSEPQRGDLARAALLTVANTPELFGASTGEVAGIPYAAVYPILEDAPRYLHWLASQGLLGTVQPWIAIVAADLGRRVRWRRCVPRRGAGRLLWMCEQMATPTRLQEFVPRLWHAAVGRGHSGPDWRPGPVPLLCQLDEVAYREVLRDRATDSTFTISGDVLYATGPSGSALVVFNGRDYRSVPIQRGSASLAMVSAPDTAAAVFTWRGDYRATNWLAEYNNCVAADVVADGADAPAENG